MTLISSLASRTISFILFGEVPSKKNSWALGNGKIYTPNNIKRWVKDSIWLLKPVMRKHKMITEKCQLEAQFYIKHDKDIDNMLGSLMDLLQGAGLLKNDRLVVEVLAKKHKVKINPHVQVRLLVL